MGAPFSFSFPALHASTCIYTCNLETCRTNIISDVRARRMARPCRAHEPHSVSTSSPIVLVYSMSERPCTRVHQTHMRRRRARARHRRSAARAAGPQDQDHPRAAPCMDCGRPAGRPMNARGGGDLSNRRLAATCDLLDTDDRRSSIAHAGTCCAGTQRTHATTDRQRASERKGAPPCTVATYLASYICALPS